MPDLTPVQAQWLTLGFMIVITALVIGFDVLVIQAYGTEASISRVLRRLFMRSPLLFTAFLFWLGVLVGHVHLPAN